MRGRDEGGRDDQGTKGLEDQGTRGPKKEKKNKKKEKKSQNKYLPFFKYFSLTQTFGGTWVGGSTLTSVM